MRLSNFLLGIAALAGAVQAAAIADVSVVPREAEVFLARRAECSAIIGTATPACQGLSQRCGITIAQLQQFNPGLNCNALAPYQRVCCNAGDIPVPPKQGECTTIVGSATPACDGLSQRCGITVSQLQQFNPTMNCNALSSGQRVCCNAGNMPAQGQCTAISGSETPACEGLSIRCGITIPQLQQFNPGLNCNALYPGVKVCCNAGPMPIPENQADGTCSVYTVQSGDYCALIAARLGLTVSQLESFNVGKTWGWAGCNALQPGQRICQSSGTRPMPVQRAGVQCGPQVVGTVKPASASVDLATLNPCPLSACCSGSGYCGTNEDYCVATKGPTGNPGTFAPGTNGCISNCGLNVVNNAQPPASFKKIGYFQGYNVAARPCLHMNVTDTPSDFTHIHFSFATLSTAWDVIISPDMDEQFALFKAQTKAKKILVIGGWTFSTSPSTYMIFRNMVATDANINTAVAKIGDFLRANNLDGVDFDWEYPGSPDTAGLPAAPANEGDRFNLFLQAMRKNIPLKSLSIAAPASYYYLKNYPLAAIASSLDYLVVMTYDFFMQSDYGYADKFQGCPGGNCLRSHVNSTLTTQALAMVTRAGFPANKVIVGVSSYGRAFQMAQAGCAGELCKFTGPASGALSGRCTREQGMLADAEIAEIIATNPTSQQYTLAGSDILVYNSTQYVSYMKETTKATRTAGYKALNLGGTCDWAIDFQRFWPGQQ